MKKLFLILLIVFSLFAKENYSEMSTQELIAIIGYVDKKDEARFNKELQKRVPKMTQKEKELYEKSLKK